MRKTFRIGLVALVLVLLTTLVACAPKDAEAAKKKLEKKDYTVYVGNTEEVNFLKLGLAALGVEVDSIVMGVKGEEDKDGDAVVGLFFDSKNVAKEQMEKVEKFVNNMGDKDEKPVIKQSGRWIYFGTEQGVKDFA